MVAGAAVTVLGLLVLSGWLFDLPYLTSFRPGQTTMKPNTAVCFVLLGVGLCLLARDGPIARGTARVTASLVALIAVATLIEYGTSGSLGIDELLFRDPRTPPELNPGRMAVATAVVFLLTAAALLLTARSVRHGASGPITLALSVAVVAIGALGLLGYGFQVVFLYTWYSFGSIGVHAAAGFILLGAGLIAAGRAGAAPSPPVSEEQRITRAAALALVVAASAMGIGERRCDEAGWLPLGVVAYAAPKRYPRSTPQRGEASHGPYWHRRAQEGQADLQPRPGR